MPKSTKKYLNLLLFLLILLVLYFLFEPAKMIVNILNSIFIPFLLSFALAFIFQPIVNFFKKKFSIKPLFTNIILSVVIVLVLALFIFKTIPSLSTEIYQISSDFISSLEELINNSQNSAISSIINYIDLNAIVTSIQSYLISFLTSFGSQLTNIILIPVLFIYFLFGYESIKENIRHFLLKFHLYSQYEFLRRFQNQLFIYLKGLSITITLLSTACALAFTLLGLPNGVFLGIFIGLSSIIPIFGAIVSGGVAVILAYGVSFELAIAVLLVIAIAQLIESNVITPNLQGKNLDVHPVIILLSLTVFSVLFGFLGMLLTLPLLISTRIAFDMFFKDKIIESRSLNENIQKDKDLYNL